MKPNTATAQNHPEDSPIEASPSFIPAPLPSRAIAAVIDYLTVSPLLFFTASQMGYSDRQFLIPLVIGALYYSVGNSVVTNGQTLGKKVFGLRTVLLQDAPQPRYIGLGRSFIRFIFAFGCLILLAELPPLFYRHYEVVGTTGMLELHMLLTLILFLVNVSLVLFHPARRALHDSVAGTVVVRVSDIEIRDQKALAIPIKPAFLGLALIVGATLGYVFWSLGRVHDDTTAKINAYRYPIEARLPLRILSISKAEESIEIFAILLPIDKEEVRDVALKLAQLSEGYGNFQSSSIRTLQLRFIAPHEESERELHFTYDIATQELS